MSRRRASAPAEKPGYETAKREAQANADRYGFDYGIEPNAFGWSVFMLPCIGNRYGRELSCEVVHPTDIAKCQPGHGPKGR